MKNTIKSIYLILGLVPGLASATLGDRTVASIGRIQKKSITPSQTLQFQTSQDNAVTIKEYADENGFIYAVSWQGPHHPDLATLLGRYFPEYKVAIAITPSRIPRRKISATSQNLMISQFGHPGALNGIIYLKDRLPENVNPEDLL